MIEIENLKVNYGAIEAVRDISLSINEGELVTLLGANGAGKSSTIMCIAGALKASKGKILINGDDFTAASPEKIVSNGIATVPETRDVFSDLTVKENLVLGSYTRRKDKSGVKDDFEKVMKMFPRLKERSEQAAGTLSGGEQQMLVIARALMSRPKILLLDEPSLGLAPAIVDQIFDLIEELKESGLTILLVEQNAKKALEIADRAYVLQLGRIVASGTAHEILNSTNLNSLYLGS